MGVAIGAIDMIMLIYSVYKRPCIYTWFINVFRMSETLFTVPYIVKNRQSGRSFKMICYVELLSAVQSSY